MPPERPVIPEHKKGPRDLYPSAFRYFEQLEEEATALGSRLEATGRIRDLAPGEREAMEAAAHQNEICEDMLEELEAGNLSHVIAYLQRTVQGEMGKPELGPEAIDHAEKAGRALVELQQAQEKMLH